MHQGRIDGSGIRAGVTCQRCHGPRAAHVASEGAVSGLSWRDVGQQEAINRCAQCHRRAEEQGSESITPENVDIVRFQPVGLVQSACYRRSAGMTCTTCHDPHRPMEDQDSLGIWQCVQCHDPEHDDQTMCGAGRTDACLDCHMPRRRMDAPLQFTDHWIRVPESEDASP
jgi:hypothetical protein